MRKVRTLQLMLVLFAAHINLTALVPLQAGDPPPPPWWVGGRLLWPFAIETETLLNGDIFLTITPILAIVSGLCFLLAAGALRRWHIPHTWFSPLIIAGAMSSIVLQVIWFTGWAILPLIVDFTLLWMVLGMRIAIDRQPMSPEIRV